MPNLSISLANASDAPTILGFIAELAEYEKLSHEAVGTVEKLRATVMGPRPYARAFIAKMDGQPVGFALFFYNYSTFLTQPGVYLEDLYVTPDHRGSGVGKALLQSVARHAVEIGAGRLEWSVLDWNEPAIGFYKRIGAVPMEEWTVFRLTGEALAEFGAGRVELSAPTLTTNRLELRVPVAEDAPRLYDLLQDPRIEENLGGLPWPFTLSDAEHFVRRRTANDATWVLTLPEQGPVGTIQLSLTPQHRRGYLGFWLGTPYWGQGLMPEAIAAVLDHGFGPLDLARIEAEHFTDNPASGKAMAKAGMTKEGTRLKAFVKHGVLKDLTLYAATQPDP